MLILTRTSPKEASPPSPSPSLSAWLVGLTFTCKNAVKIDGTLNIMKSGLPCKRELSFHHATFFQKNRILGSRGGARRLTWCLSSCLFSLFMHPVRPWARTFDSMFTKVSQYIPEPGVPWPNRVPHTVPHTVLLFFVNISTLFL